MKILFSPIGKSDPISHLHDGPWLHMVRHIAPDKCILFLSQEMCEREKESGMYSFFFDRINKWMADHGRISKPIDFTFSKHTEMTEPHRRVLYDVFTKELKDIHREYPDAVIYLNCNSGTPAMSAALESLFHFLQFKTVLCNVPMPKLTEKDKNSSSRPRVGTDFDKQTEWELNEDNDVLSPCRLEMLEASKETQFGVQLQLAQVKTLISNYEFASAGLALQQIQYDKDERLDSLLRGATERQQCNYRIAGIDLKNGGWAGADRMLQSVNDPLYQAAEVVLTMQIAFERDDIGEMLRRITPVMIPLAEAVMKKNGIDPEDIEITDTKGRICLDSAKLKKANEAVYDAVKGEVFKYESVPVLYDWHLLKIIDVMAPNSEQYKALAALREVENIRNTAAHTIAAINDQWLKGKTGFSAEDVLNKLKKLILWLNPGIGKAFWKSYENLAEYIISLL